MEQFKKGFGYKEEGVDAYIALLVAEKEELGKKLEKFAEILKAINAKNAALTAENNALKTEGAKIIDEKAENNALEPEDTKIIDEKTARMEEISAALVSAQVSARQTEEAARREAEEIIQEANKNADQLLFEARQELVALQEAITLLRGQMLDVRQYIGEVINKMNDETENR